MSLTLYGGQKINYFWLDSKIHTSDEIAAISANDTTIDWTYTTQALAPFNSSLQAGNVDDLEGVLTAWRVYRINTTNEDTQYKLVCETSDASITSIRDYMVSNNNTYRYQIVGMSDNYISDSIYSDTVTCDFYGWSLTDINTNETWLFKCTTGDNIEGNFTVNNNVSISTTNSMYPVFSIGQQRYLSTTISALIGSINQYNKYVSDNVKIRNLLIDFLNNGNEKIIKNPVGDILKVQTYCNEFVVDNKTNEKEQTINFNIVQIGNSDDLQVYEEL